MEHFIEIHEVKRIYYSEVEYEHAVMQLYYDHSVLCGKDNRLPFNVFERIVNNFKERLIKENYNCEKLNKEIYDDAEKWIEILRDKKGE